MVSPSLSFFFFFNDTATTEIYTLSLHDALPISFGGQVRGFKKRLAERVGHFGDAGQRAFQVQVAGVDETKRDRKSTRLNSSHQIISYAVFCLKKKKKQTQSHNDSRD